MPSTLGPSSGLSFLPAPSPRARTSRAAFRRPLEAPASRRLLACSPFRSVAVIVRSSARPFCLFPFPLAGERPASSFSSPDLGEGQGEGKRP